MRYSAILATIKEDAEKAGVKVQEFLNVGAVIEERHHAEEAARSSSEDEKTKLRDYIVGLNGEVVNSARAPMADICKAAGVRINQGNSSVARHLVKQALLTYQPAEQAEPEEPAPQPAPRQRNRQTAA